MEAVKWINTINGDEYTPVRIKYKLENISVAKFWSAVSLLNFMYYVHLIYGIYSLCVVVYLHTCIFVKTVDVIYGIWIVSSTIGNYAINWIDSLLNWNSRKRLFLFG